MEFSNIIGYKWVNHSWKRSRLLDQVWRTWKGCETDWIWSWTRPGFGQVLEWICRLRGLSIPLEHSTGSPHHLLLALVLLVHKSWFDLLGNLSNLASTLPASLDLVSHWAWPLVDLHLRRWLKLGEMPRHLLIELAAAPIKLQELPARHLLSYYFDSTTVNQATLYQSQSGLDLHYDPRRLSWVSQITHRHFC